MSGIRGGSRDSRSGRRARGRLTTGATQGRALRDAAVLSTLAYISADLVLSPRYGNTGVWTAMLLLYVARAAALGIRWPALRRAAA